MKKLLVLASALLSAGVSLADNNPLWMRYPAISPDGKTVAFTYKGDIYTVPAAGGRAVQLTTNPAHDTRPVWSPDGTRIAFASNREGSFDVFVMSSGGGVPTRVTTHTAAEYPETFRDNGHVLYSASIIQDVRDIQFPGGQFAQIYEVSVDGGRPKMFSSLAMQGIAFDRTGGRMLYHDLKGYEDPWRKHHQSSIARDIWLCTLGGKRVYSKLTAFKGEDRNPVWTADGNSYYSLSERDGNFNIYKSGLDGSAARQLTHYEKHPVRFLSSSSDGLLCYGYDGEIYTLREGGQPVKVAVSIVSDKVESDLVHRTMWSGATSMAVSPNGKEVAFIVRGDVYVTSMDYETTRRVTNTPQQERNVVFSPDGRSMAYSAERGDTWGIYQSSLVRKEDKYFTYAREVKEEPLVVTGNASFQPDYSPDGKELAFLEDRTTLRVVNLKSKKVRTVLDGKFNYSYADGDISYQWSPDSKWFLADYIGVGGWNNKDIALVKADGSGEVVDLTESGYSDSNAKWVLGGKAMIWQSDRAGYRSHGSWGAQNDVYIMFFDGEAYDKFRLNKEELALAEEAGKDDGKDKAGEEDKDAEKKGEKDKDKKSKDKKEKGKKGGKEKKDDQEKPLVFDLENRRDRVMRLTINSSNMGDAVLTPSGDKLYYCAAFESGHDLWERNFRENTTKLLIKGVGGGSMEMDKKGDNIFLLSGGQMKKIEARANKVTGISFRADFELRPPQERDYIFNHVWRQVQDKFYDKALHGVDWAGYKEAYARFLPHVNNNFDFAELLSEMLGELNGSHTGARYGGSVYAPATATLGAFYDDSHAGDGLKVAEVIAKGPMAKADTKIKKGCVIEKIDGQPVKAGEDYYPLLNGKVGKKVLLSVYDPARRKRFEQVVKPISAGEERGLLYKRWVDGRRRLVDSLSGGKVGYVHVQGMNSESFREAYSELLGRCRNKEAVIVDTRHNGGGWLHDDLATLLNGKEYQQFAPRGQYIGSDPFNKWLKPSCVLVCEDNYSNAHGFPWVYKALGIGKLIGAPVPGTMTAVWWETQIDPSIVFGIPQVGVRDMEGNYLENMELKPDVEVYNSPEDQLSGRDAQLEKAVEVMLGAVEQ